MQRILFILITTFCITAYSAESGINNHNNPFTKPSTVSGNTVVVMPPNNMPLGSNLPMVVPRGLPEEPNEPAFDWNNLKAIGYINNSIILRIYNKNSQIEPKTILTSFGNKFLLNGNYYTIQNNNKIFTIFNGSKAVYRLNFESSPTRLIQNTMNNSNIGNNSNVLNSVTPINSGATVGK